jgi:two-component system LytT family response regulator
MTKAIIIDDEERARNGLRQLLALSCPDVEVLADCADVPSAVIAINRHRPDVVFLDIEMPQYSGLELFNFFSEVSFEVIFVTAYSEFAIRAFELNAIDYLLKPVDGEKLKNAVSKLERRNSERYVALQEGYARQEFHRIGLPVSDGLLFVEVANIMLLEAEGAYTHVWLRDGSKLLVSKRLIFFEQVLGDRPFMIRVHRSFMVNFNHVTKYSKAESLLTLDNGKMIPVPKEKKAEIEEALRRIRVG